MSRLGDRLRVHARDRPDAHAVHAERWWTYRELVEAAGALAIGAGPGDVVAIAIDRGIEAVVAVCAAALAGAIPAVIDPGDHELAARTLGGLRPATVLVAPGDEDLPGARVIERAGERDAWRLVDANAAAWDALRRPPEIAHVIFTSGSTATSKGVVWSELRAGYDRLLNRPRRPRLRPSGIVVPLCTGLGFHELIHALFHGASVALLEAPFPAAIGEARALGVDRLKLTPTHVELLLATAEELPGLRTVAVSAAPIAPARLRALAARVPSARVCRSYGLTESGTATMVWVHRSPKKLRTVGRPVGLRRVTVRDPAGRMLPPGQIGEVVIELPMWDAVDGYLDAAPELARQFDNGALWTGDRGAIDEHGFLVLGPRTAEILKVGGRSTSAPRIEERLAALDEIAEVAVVGVPDRLLGEVPCAVFVPSGRGARLADGAAPAIEIRSDELPRWFLARRALPRGPSGKLRRGLLAEEAVAWTRSFPRAFAPEHRPFPAFDLEHGTAIVDGCPPVWTGDTAGLDPAARIIALVARKPARPLALAVVQAGARGVDAAVRFVVGPVAVELPGRRVADDLLDAFAGELILLAGALPGPRAVRICAFPGGPRRALDDAGFAPHGGGWLAREVEGAAAAPPVDAAALDEIAAVAPLVAAWAAHCAEAVQRRSSGSDA